MSISTKKGSGDLCSAVIDLALASEEGDGDGPGSTPESLFYVLPYVGLRELLVLEIVSKQLRDAIRGDVLLWQQLHVDSPLNKKFTDVELARLASRALGRLQSLDLDNCTRVSEEAVETVVASNPELVKLSLPGCTKVSPEAILRMMKKQTEGRSPEAPTFTQLRIRGIYGITTETLEALHSMMIPTSARHSSGHPTSPQFYKNGEPSSAIEESRSIDVEVCPKCGTARMVYDCPRPTCQLRSQLPLRQCRGCYSCIARCEECGTCIDGDDYEETFCLEILCQACWLLLPKCAECNRAGCSRHVEGLGMDVVTHGASFTCDSCQAIQPGGSWPEFD